MDDTPAFLRRKQAGEYLKTKYGFCSGKGLGVYATIGGGPPFRKVGLSSRAPVVYERAALDTGALGKMSAPLKSTTDYLPDVPRKCSPGRPRIASKM